MANSAPDGAIEFISSGDPVIYTYTVVNIGDTYLSDITVTDDVLGVIGTVAGPLAPGATNTLNSLAPFVLSSVTNIGDVVANPTDSLGTDLADLSDVTASDDAVVQVVGPALSLVKTAGQRGRRRGRIHRRR